MKKIAVILLSLIMVTVLGACSNADSKDQGTIDDKNVTADEKQGTDAKEADYPTGDITMVVPVKAGGDTDSYARILSKYMSEDLGVNVTVENVDGASGTVGSRQVYESEPNGTNLLFFHDAAILSKISGATDIALSDYKIVSIPVQDTTSTLVVNAKKFSSVEDFVERAKSGEKIIASAAAGSLSILAPLELQKELGVEFKYVDSTSAADRVADLLAGRIDLFYTQYATIEQYIQNGDFMSLGIMSEERNENFADVPTLKEQGIDISMPKFFYVACAPETPDYIINRLETSIEAACANEGMKEELAQFYVSPSFMTSEESLNFVKEKEETYSAFSDLLN